MMDTIVATATVLGWIAWGYLKSTGLMWVLLVWAFIEMVPSDRRNRRD